MFSKLHQTATESHSSKFVHFFQVFTYFSKGNKSFCTLQNSSTLGTCQQLFSSELFCWADSRIHGFTDSFSFPCGFTDSRIPALCTSHLRIHGFTDSRIRAFCTSHLRIHGFTDSRIRAFCTLKTQADSRIQASLFFGQKRIHGVRIHGFTDSLVELERIHGVRIHGFTLLVQFKPWNSVRTANSAPEYWKTKNTQKLKIIAWLETIF